MNKATFFFGFILLIAGCAHAPERAGAASSEPDAYQKSYTLEAEGKYAEAADELTRLGGDVKSPYTYNLRLGWLLYLAGEYQKSVSYYEKAIQEVPVTLEARQGLLLPLMAMRQFDRAEKIGLEITNEDPLNYLGNFRLAIVYYESAKYDKAESYYRKLLQYYPGIVAIRTGLGWSLLKQGKREEARRHFQTVLQVAPRYEQANEGLSSTQ